MEVSRVSNGEIIKNTEILPKAIGGNEDNLFQVQILHYIEPGQIEETLIGDYVLRIYSEFGPSESVSAFSIVKSSMSVIVTQNAVEELVTLEEELNLLDDSEESEMIENLVQSESKIPSWVHDIFVWYADEIISENELLTALQYLIEQGILVVDSN